MIHLLERELVTPKRELITPSRHLFTPPEFRRADRALEHEFDLQQFSSQNWAQDLAPWLVGPFTTVTAAAITALWPDVPLPAYQVMPGWKCKIEAYGKITTAASTPGTATFTVNWGGTGGTLLVTSAALTYVASATNIPFKLEYLIICQSAVAAGTIGLFVQGMFWTTTAVLATPAFAMIPASAPAVVTGLTASASEALNCSITMSAATNSVTVDEVSILSTAIGM